VIERRIAARGIPIVYDFDDAIFLPSVSEANRAISFLKSTSRPATIIGFSRHVMVGNDFLAQYARRFNPNVTVVPTAVDTARFAPRPAGPQMTQVDPGPPVTQMTQSHSGRLVVGWIGSPTTFHYLESIAPLLQRVAASHPFVLRVSGAGKPVRFPGVTVEEVAWSLDREVTLFNTCDIGVYPLDDDDWARGKCGFKAIQFMACGVPTLAAAVGVNREIIRDGENGFLAATAEAWVAKLERLLTDPQLRERFARAGRETIDAQYSTRVTAPMVAGILREAAGARQDTRHETQERKGR
jgi:glycosyltransferase involved in cell wall biosynthesis